MTGRALVFLLAFTALTVGQDGNHVGAPVADAHTIDAAHLIQPAELAAILKSGAKEKPLLLMVGFRTMYMTRRIPGAEYIGATAEPAGIQRLRDRIKDLPKGRSIVLYCGCCPWPHCPNVDPAFAELRALGFTNVKVLYLASNFGSDWVEKGYPVEKGS
jgi:rhodanese-related sulfurtransferase